MGTSQIQIESDIATPTSSAMQSKRNLSRQVTAAI
jgi:hypothetical protein